MRVMAPAVHMLAATLGCGLLLYLAYRRSRRLPQRSDPLLLLDGGTGLELKRRKAQGLPVAYDLTLFSTAALRDTPDALVDLHRDYIKAGCTVLTTASYAITRFYLDKVNEGSRVKELAERSVALAKEARAAECAEERVLIAGSVPPLGESYQAAALPTDELQAQYAELLAGLSGCDVYLCETMGTLADGVVGPKTETECVPICATAAAAAAPSALPRPVLMRSRGAWARLTLGSGEHVPDSVSKRAHLGLLHSPALR